LPLPLREHDFDNANPYASQQNQDHCRFRTETGSSTFSRNLQPEAWVPVYPYFFLGSRVFDSHGPRVSHTCADFTLGKLATYQVIVADGDRGSKDLVGRSLIVPFVSSF